MSVTWDSERRAQVLLERREALIDRLPGEIRAARDVRPDVRELIVDEAIGYVALDHRGPLASEADLERLFWGACAKRVRRALYQRAYDTVRGRWRPATAEALDRVADGPDPAAEVVRREEQRTALEFATMLSPRERQVFACKYGGELERGYKDIARHLGLPVLQVRSAERSIAGKLERFAAIVSAGRLCGYRAPVVASLAAGRASEREGRTARAHLTHCAPCTAEFKRQLHYMHGAVFARKVAALLPVPPAAARELRPGAGFRDALVDWLGRPVGSDAATSTAQLTTSGVGRGAGAALAAKLAALCLAGGGTVGLCVATGFLPPPGGSNDRAQTPTRPRTPASTPDRLPTRAEASLIATPTPTPTPARRQRRRRSTGSARSSAAQGGTTSTSHEQTPASPPVSEATTAGGSGEFNFEQTPRAEPRPAPVPRAPGAREFP